MPGCLQVWQVKFTGSQIRGANGLRRFTCFVYNIDSEPSMPCLCLLDSYCHMFLLVNSQNKTDWSPQTILSHQSKTLYCPQGGIPKPYFFWSFFLLYIRDILPGWVCPSTYIPYVFFSVAFLNQMISLLWDSHTHTLIYCLSYASHQNKMFENKSNVQRQLRICFQVYF